VALANGTLALDVALKALGIGPGDEVVVTPRTIAAVLSPRTRAVVCVHLAGWPCDMDPIMALAGQHDFKVIEDCAQAHGARYKGRPVGSIGHVGAWSFCQAKIMTTGGEGGMVTTNDEALWRAMWSFKDHGKSYEAVYERQHAPGFRWLHESFGTNWRMLEMQAVIGRIQLQRMSDWSAARKRNAEAIWAACRDFSALRVPVVGCAGCGGDGLPRCARNDGGCEHAHYKCYVYVQPNRLAAGWTRDRIIEAINVEGVPCYQGSCSEVYLEKAFDGTGWRPEVRLPVAKALGETSVMFLVHPTLTEAEIDKTCDAIKTVLTQASHAN
jgi:dTDP-4-amino-4,6-dideoxygalactose transaminase